MKNILYSLLFFFCIGNSIAQQTPADKQRTAVSIEGATAHLGNGKVIENSLIMFHEGKITFVGSAMAKIARQGNVINAKGKHVYPGFIAANSTLGLVEIDAVKASDDQREIGLNNPHIRSLIAYNAESKVVESMRPNGVLMAQIRPKGGTISGTSSIVQLDAWNWEDAAMKTDDGIHMNWPNSFTRGRWWLGEDPGLKTDTKYPENIDRIKSYFLNAKNYLAGMKEKKHLPYEATKGLFDGSKKLYIHVDGPKEITDAITIAIDLGIDNLVIVDAEGADKVTDLLVKHNIPVILPRPHRNPDSEDDAYDATYTIAKTLTEKGVLVSLGMDGQMERMNTRNLPFYAGTFAAFGLDKEVALQLITLNTAKILGIDAMVGSLEVGKDATLFISEGDALEMRGNILTKAYIQGRDISLETHQTTLWKRYAEKYKSR
ncbi:amidohydrolase family protein [Polaribacter litorisediminis]|uniref:amidohydrolase family protein n=1 Tax=Polaribacter litorisediminis TaxID=1908341 RepID=UPI001CC19B9A|nr:amidohydrolase family protein [Polaribacter litorisediminis]UAM99236.1 amidohydrolase family protein [Polaribacter litorisediminis]